MELKELIPSSEMSLVGLSGLGIGILFIWSIIWKGQALWRSAQKNDTAWFIIFMIVNTIGILEIVYLYIVAPKKKTQKES